MALLMHRVGAVILLSATLLSSAMLAQSSVAPQKDLTQASLEDLLSIQVTSVAKKEQTVARADAAIFVITQEDIRRSGATNLPDVLRMAPGVHVAEINANTWSVNIRGMSERYGDMVLVLIDGRSIYGGSHAGVEWDAHPLPLEDIERIEVIRGTAGTVWGANAVNGVINIITKSAKATLGGLASAGAGSADAVRGFVQYGAKAGDKGAYRIFADAFDSRSQRYPGGAPFSDSWYGLTLGFRSDWQLTSRDSLSIQGEARRIPERQAADTLFSNLGYTNAVIQERGTIANENLLGRWTRTLDRQAEFSLQMFVDRSFRIDQGVESVEKRADIDFRHRLAPFGNQELTWGAGFRRISDNIRPGFSTSYDPPRRSDNLYSAFFQDEWKITSHASLTIGSRLEHNDFSGFEYEPSVQFVWSDNRNSVWASESRAIRQPSLTDVGIHDDQQVLPLPNGQFGVEQQVGTLHPNHELAYASQAGYRRSIGKHFSIDGTAFYTAYRDLQTSEPGTPYFVNSPGPAHWVYPLVYASLAEGTTFGAEVFAAWNVTRNWKLMPSCSWLRSDVDPLPGSRDTSAEEEDGRTPGHLFQLRSQLSLPKRLEWDSSFAFVGRLNESATPTPRQHRLDMRLGWKAGESLEFSLTGQNLLTRGHLESSEEDGVLPSLVTRRVFVRATWRF